MSRPLRVAINAQIKPGSGVGGIESVLRMLSGITRLDGDEEYVFIGPFSDAHWLQPLQGLKGKTVRGPGPIEMLRSGIKSSATIAESGGFYESLNCDVIHFPYQQFVRTRMPSVFNPHDLQHLHLPQYFGSAELKRREETYGPACRHAAAVVVSSTDIKQDVVDNYGVDPENVEVIPWAPLPLGEASNRGNFAAVQRMYSIPDMPIALYPAMTWEHKNHLGLLDAIAVARDRRELGVHVVCTGKKTSFWPRIEERLTSLDLRGQVTFTGMVSGDELSILYRRALFVILPTLFEAGSAPLFEAWQYGAPVACSALPSLQEQAGAAAMLMDAASTESIAHALRAMTMDSELRSDLMERGTRRLEDFSSTRTLESYRGLYHRVAVVGDG